MESIIKNFYLKNIITFNYNLFLKIFNEHNKSPIL